MQKITISPILQVDMLIGLEGRFPSELWYGIFPLSLPSIFWPGLVRMGRIRQLDSKNQSPVKQRQSSIKTCGVPIKEQIFQNLFQEDIKSTTRWWGQLTIDVITLTIFIGFTGNCHCFSREQGSWKHCHGVMCSEAGWQVTSPFLAKHQLRNQKEMSSFNHLIPFLCIEAYLLQNTNFRVNWSSEGHNTP